MKTILLSLAVLLVTMSEVNAHTGNDERTPIGSYGPVQLVRRVQKNNDTGYTITYNKATIRMPKMRLYELLDALQNIQGHTLKNEDIPLILHGGLQLQQVVVSGVTCIRITDRKNKSTILTPEQQQHFTIGLQEEIQPTAMVSMN